MTKEPYLQMPKSRAHVWSEHLLSNYLQKSGHMRKLIHTKQPFEISIWTPSWELYILLSPLIFPTILGGRDVIICIFQTSFWTQKGYTTTSYPLCWWMVKWDVNPHILTAGTVFYLCFSSWYKRKMKENLKDEILVFQITERVKWL